MAFRIKRLHMDFAPVTQAGAFCWARAFAASPQKGSPGRWGAPGLQGSIGGNQTRCGGSIANPYLMRLAVIFITCRCGPVWQFRPITSVLTRSPFSVAGEIRATRFDGGTV